MDKLVLLLVALGLALWVGWLVRGGVSRGTSSVSNAPPDAGAAREALDKAKAEADEKEKRKLLAAFLSQYLRG